MAAVHSPCASCISRWSHCPGRATHVGRFCQQLPPGAVLRFDDFYSRRGKPRHCTVWMVWLGYPDAVQCMQGRPGACRCERSSGLLPTHLLIQSLSPSLRKDGATVIWSCKGRYHTIPYSWSPAEESARQSKTVHTLKPSACSLPGDVDDAFRK